MKPSSEYRSAPFVEIEAAADGSSFSGYAAVFDETADLGDFTESVARGAFRKVLSHEQNVPMLFNHNDDLPPLATTKAGTLTLFEDAKGLRVEARIGNHFVAQAVREMIERREIAGMSYGFVAGAGNSKIEHRNGKVHRTLTGFNRLLDVSPTHDPAFGGTSAELRQHAAVAVDLQQLLEGADQQQEDGADLTDDQDETAVAETEHRSDGADAHWRLAAAQRWLAINRLPEGNHEE